MMNLTKKILASSILITATAFSNQVSATVIGGINIGSTGAVSMQDISAETIVTTAGQVLQGIGHISAINNNLGFASGVELNFIYSATVDFVSGDGTVIIFEPGNLTFFTNTIGTYNIGSFTSMANAQSTISSGTDWLDLQSTTVSTLSPYNVTGAPATGGFFGTGTNFSGTNPNGSGVGYFSVIAGLGLANSTFDTNALLFNGITPYDLLFTSTFSVPINPITGSPTNPSWGIVQDASTFAAATNNVDEPDTLALLGLGLLATALLSRRRQPGLKLI